MTQTRKSRAQELTWCSSCQNWAGVTRTQFNRYPRENNPARITAHKRADGTPCGNSRATLPATAQILSRAEALTQSAG